MGQTYLVGGKNQSDPCEILHGFRQRCGAFCRTGPSGAKRQLARRRYPLAAQRLRGIGAKCFGAAPALGTIGGSWLDARKSTDAQRSVSTITTKRRRRVQLEGASREAEGYLELGMHAHALASLQRRGKLVHGNSHACYLLGECLREMHRYSEAIYPLRRSVQLNPTPTEGWLALGWCYKRAGRIDESIRALEQALTHQPDAAIVHYNLACYHSLVGSRLDAVRRLRRALSLDASLRRLVDDEPDFDPLREDPLMRMLLAASA